MYAMTPQAVGPEVRPRWAVRQRESRQAAAGLIYSWTGWLRAPNGSGGSRIRFCKEPFAYDRVPTLQALLTQALVMHLFGRTGWADVKAQ